jgi:hypothetical protein
MGSYTLVLTRGTHVVDRRAGLAILGALADRQPVVSIDVDLLCDGFVKRGVQIITSHVVALIPDDEADTVRDEIPFGPNVTPLRQIGQAR